MKENRGRRLATVLLLFLAIPFAPSQALSFTPRGLDPEKEISQYAHRAWTKHDGLPQNSVLAITQTRDGYIWLGTMEGLARFDGAAFRVFNVRNTPELKMQVVSALLADDDGRLWVGTNGGGLSIVQDGVFRHVNHPKELGQAAVAWLYKDSHGIMWAATNAGLAAIRGDSVMRIYSTADGLPHKALMGLAEDLSGRILVATKGGVLVLDHECFLPFEPAKEIDGVPTCLAVDTTNSEYWLGTYEGSVWCVRNGVRRQYSVKDGLPGAPVTRIFKDQRGSVWAAPMGEGLHRIYDGRISRFSSVDGLSGDEVSALFEDREGNLWAGVTTGGVNRFVNSKFTTFKTGSTSGQNMIWMVCQDERGTVLAGSADGHVYEFTGKKFVPLKELPKALPSYATFVVRDGEGSLWIGSPHGLWRAMHGTVRCVAKENVRTILKDSRGRIWVGTAFGLRLLTHGKLVHVAVDTLGEKLDIRLLYEDRHANLWIGTRGAGLLRAPLPMQRNSVTSLDARRMWYVRDIDYGVNWVSSISEDESGTLWVTTYGGSIISFDGDVPAVVDVRHGVPEEALHTALDDRQGNLWISSNNGIYRIRKSDHRAVASGALSVLPYTAFGASDGMASDECNGGFQSSGVRSRDGKLWFPTVMGVVMVDPLALPYNDVPPAIVFEGVQIDHQDVFRKVVPSMPPGNGDMVFQYTALWFSSPENVRFKYMLEGFNTDWVDAGNRREAFYTNIPPGSYTFRVKACNADGVWNEAGASFAFSLQPHFQQTVWFYILIGLVLALSTAGGLHLYRRDRDRELQASQLESQLAQAQLKVLEMQLQPHFLFNTLNGIMVLIREDPEKARAMIARLSELLRMTLHGDGTQEVPLRKEMEFLDRYIQIEMIRFEDRLSVVQDIRFDLEDALVPYMILQPLVENAIRHGLAKRRGQALISIHAARENGSLTIHVRDNGSGLDSSRGASLREGIGLSNIRARLHHLYGEHHTFELTSPAEGGVDVRLTIPWRQQLVT